MCRPCEMEVIGRRCMKKKPVKVTINHLPPELISQIVQHVLDLPFDTPRMSRAGQLNMMDLLGAMVMNAFDEAGNEGADGDDAETDVDMPPLEDVRTHVNGMGQASTSTQRLPANSAIPFGTVGPNVPASATTLGSSSSTSSASPPVTSQSAASTSTSDFLSAGLSLSSPIKPATPFQFNFNLSPGNLGTAKVHGMGIGVKNIETRLPPTSFQSTENVGVVGPSEFSRDSARSTNSPFGFVKESIQNRESLKQVRESENRVTNAGSVYMSEPTPAAMPISKASMQTSVTIDHAAMLPLINPDIPSVDELEDELQNSSEKNKLTLRHMDQKNIDIIKASDLEALHDEFQRQIFRIEAKRESFENKLRGILKENGYFDVKDVNSFFGVVRQSDQEMEHILNDLMPPLCEEMPREQITKVELLRQNTLLSLERERCLTQVIGLTGAYLQMRELLLEGKAFERKDRKSEKKKGSGLHWSSGFLNKASMSSQPSISEASAQSTVSVKPLSTPLIVDSNVKSPEKSNKPSKMQWSPGFLNSLRPTPRPTKKKKFEVEADKDLVDLEDVGKTNINMMGEKGTIWSPSKDSTIKGKGKQKVVDLDADVTMDGTDGDIPFVEDLLTEDPFHKLDVSSKKEEEQGASEIDSSKKNVSKTNSLKTKASYSKKFKQFQGEGAAETSDKTTKATLKSATADPDPIFPDLTDDEDDEFDNDDQNEFAQYKIINGPTYPDGLPLSPLLSLCLVNKNFLKAAREKLYRHVTLYDAYQASLFFRTLDSLPVCIPIDEGRNTEQVGFEYLVKGLYFMQSEDVSLGRGGGRVVLDIIKKCPRLEQLRLSMGFMASATSEVLTAIATAKNLKGFAIRSGSDKCSPMPISVPRLYKLFSHLPKLKAVDICELHGADEGYHWEEDDFWEVSEEDELCDQDENGIYGVGVGERFIAGLKVLNLSHPMVNRDEMMALLRLSKETLEEFHLRHPSLRLTRHGLCETIMVHGSALTCLNLCIQMEWHPIVAPKTAPILPYVPNPLPDTPSFEQISKAAEHPYLGDILVLWTPNLKSLTLEGAIYSNALINNLPNHIEKLSLRGSKNLTAGTVVTKLKKGMEVWLPARKMENKVLKKEKQERKRAGRPGLPLNAWEESNFLLPPEKTAVCTHRTTFQRYNAAYTAVPLTHLPMKGVGMLHLQELACLHLGDMGGWKEKETKAIVNICEKRKICLHSSPVNAGMNAAFAAMGIPIPMPMP